MSCHSSLGVFEQIRSNKAHYSREGAIESHNVKFYKKSRSIILRFRGDLLSFFLACFMSVNILNFNMLSGIFCIFFDPLFPYHLEQTIAQKPR